MKFKSIEETLQMFSKKWIKLVTNYLHLRILNNTNSLTDKVTSRQESERQKDKPVCHIAQSRKYVWRGCRRSRCFLIWDNGSKIVSQDCGKLLKCLAWITGPLTRIWSQSPSHSLLYYSSVAPSTTNQVQNHAYVCWNILMKHRC